MKIFKRLNKRGELCADIKITDLETKETYVCNKANMAKNKVHADVWFECLLNEDNFKMGNILGEPIFI